MSTGFVLNIPQEMLNRLEDADKKIEKLAKTSEDAQTRIVSAFKSINTHGIDAFINKLTEAQTKLANLGNTKVDFSANASLFSSLTSNARKAIDEVNNIVAAIGKIKTASGETGKMQNPFLGSGISEALVKLNAEIEQAKRNFSELQNQFTHLNVPAGDKSNLTNIQNEAQFLMEYIRVLEKEKNGLIAAKNALAEANKTLQQKDPFKAKVDDLSRESLEALRYKDSMQAMKEFYAEQDKEMKKAAKEAEADRKKREKEEKATAERIATYDSKARKERYKAYTSTYEGAMRTSDRAKTLLQEQQAIKNLEAARAKLNKTDSDYANKLRNLNQRILEHKNNIDKATAGSKNLQTQHRSLMDISGQLARKLALVFSVSQITGYVKKLIEVRGEFELQQRSLQAILQNKDEANRIWQQTVDLAVRSPFRVKELVSYTKQLAAYRIESDKLFETNKMLADISAGLGVDMQRLILAFGQVRSAAYLRGTELRQFTEAGIPILEQLAQYFTELEGRAVSVGDVFERVSKRMVSFADVEEIFKRMTSEGGTFYRMQEIQAETLQGQISNLRDSVDIMLNDIGKANETTLKNSVAMVRNFVENWEEVAAVVGHTLKILSPFIATMALAKLGSSALGKTVSSVAVGLWNFAGSIQKVGVGMTGLSIKTAVATKAVQTLKTALIGLGSGVATVALSAFVYWCLEMWRKSTEAERAVKKLDKALEDIYTQDTSTLKTQIRGFENLIGRLKEANVNTRERKEIISQINSQYGEYLGFIVDEKTSYEQLANSIDSVTLALTRRAKTTSFEKALSEVYGKTNEAIAESEKVLRDAMDDIFGTQVDGKALSLLPNEGEIIKIFDLIDKKTIELGRPLKSSEIREVLEGFYGYFVSFNTTKKEAADFMSAIEKRGQAVLTQREKELEIDRRINEVYKDNAESAAEATKAFKELEERRNAALSDAKGAPKWKIEKIKRDFEVEKIDLQVKYEGLDKATADLRKKTLESMNATVNDINKKIEGSISKLGEKYANLIYIDETEAATGVNQIAENTAAAYKAQKEILKQQNSLKEAGTAYDADILKNAQKSADAYYYKLQLLGRLDLLQKETAKEETKEMKLLRQQLAALKEAGQTYQNLRKDFDMTTAIQKTASAFKDLFAELEMTDLTKGMSFDELGILKVLEELPNKAGDAGKKAIEKLRAEFLSERDVEAQRKRSKLLLASIQEEFDRYDLSLELKKLNVPPDLAKSLFDVDYLDLEGLKKAVQDQEMKFIGTDMEKEYKDFLDKISDLQRKQREDEAKEFINFLKKNLNEIQVIQDKGAYNIALADRLFGKGRITAEQYMSSIRQIVEDTNKEVAKVNLDKFKDGATYIKAMGNLAAYSRDELEGMISALQGQVGANAGNMGADEIRAYYEALERLIDQYDKIESPFQKGEINDLIEYLSLQKRLNQEKEKEAVLERRKAELNARLMLLQNKLASQQKSGDTEGAKFTQGLIKSTVNELKEVDGQIVSVASNILVISERVEALGDGMVNSLAVAHKIVNEIANVANAATKIFDDVKSAADALGADTESGGWAKAGYAMEMVGGVSSELTQGLANFASGNFAGALANVVGMVTKLISGFAKIHDQNYQDIIEAQAEQVERLGRAYEKLETATESAYSIQQLQQYNEELERNVGLQIASYKAMIAAERAKKNTDDEQIAAWNEDLETLTQQWEDLKASLLEGVGGVSKDNYRSQAREFVDSWVSAFQETGDGLRGLKDNFREFFDNIIAEQAAMRVTEKFLEPFYESLNEALKDYELTAQESKDLREMVEKIAPDLSAALEKIWGQLGGSGGAEAGGLSALQKGIQGVTEETAQVLESLLNSMRFYVADSNAKLTQLLNNMMSGETESPMLAELRAQTKWMRDIYNLIDGMTAAHPNGGRGIKTVM